jgi:hypothetical protein
VTVNAATKPLSHDTIRAAALLRTHGFLVIAPAPASPMPGTPKPVATTPPLAADELDELARLVGTLRPDWKGDVWRFYERRSDLAARLRRLARWAREVEARMAVEAER